MCLRRVKEGVGLVKDWRRGAVLGTTDEGVQAARKRGVTKRADISAAGGGRAGREGGAARLVLNGERCS